MSILNTNKLTWFKNGGEPLKSGYVYVGQAGLDPQVPANQKAVTFTDSQGNAFTATQPLRTDTNGRVQWNGKAIIATVDGDYSLLLLDSNQTQIEDGWTPTVNGTTGGTTDLDDYREYGLTLADIKQLDVSPGETVGNIGGLAAADGNGSSWLVVSNTGSPADDIDIIDFDNGLQGVRNRNYLQPQDSLDNLASNATARDNLDVYAKSEVYTASETDTAIAEGVRPQLGVRELVFTGPSTSVDFDSFAGGHPGDGFYNVLYSSSTFNAVIYVIEGERMKDVVQSTNTTLPRSDTVEVDYTSGNVLTFTLYSTSTGVTSLSIDKIEFIG